LLLCLAAAVALRAADPEPASPAPATPAATPAAEPAPAPDLAKELAAAEDKLATALRSYTLLQNENDQLKAAAARDLSAAQSAADKTVSETQLSAARTTSEALGKVAGLQDEVRQLQAQVAAFAAENAQLRTRLALVGPPPGSVLASPTRPGAASAVLKPEPVAPAPDPAPAPRTHTVVAGDSLTKLAQHYYGSANRWDEIMKANPAIIRNANNLPLGATIRIP
jgi:nucleoid-associated protein YgaU